MDKKITKIEAQKRKGRFNVYVNGQYAFPISEEVLIKFRVFKGMAVDQQLVTQLKQADDLSKLYNRALTYLAHQLRTAYEVKSKLAESSEDAKAIEQVIDKLTDQRLIDDHKYAASYVRTVVKEQKNGPDWIRKRLKAKHVDDDIVEAAINHYFPDDEVIRIGAQVAQKQLDSHRRDSAKMAVNKTKNLLMRRGFPYSDLDQMMSQIDTAMLTNQDQSLIDKVAGKYWQKYAKLDNYEQSQKTKQALFRKGFLMDDITIALEKLTKS